MKSVNYLILLLFIGNSFMAPAQNAKQRKADRLYDNFAYYEAVDIYKELISKNFNPEENRKKLGDAYLKLRMPRMAAEQYSEVVKNENISPEYYFKYAQALRGAKRYEESREWLRKYLEAGGRYKEANNLIATDIEELEIRKDYVLEQARFNSQNSDFGAYEHNGTLYLVSARDEGLSRKTKIYAWNGQPFLDVYTVDKNTNKTTPVQGDVNTVLHDGPVSITADGKYMYFTRNNYINRKEGKRDEQKTNNLKIYRATNVNGRWEQVVELPFNDNSYSVGHPSVSSDGRTLFFASDMPNGFGGTDLYKVEILGDNSYGPPTNLGNSINTGLDESFPFIAEDNTLYFSSTGHKGFGLNDIYSVDPYQMISEVKNLGPTVNGNLDDFSYFQSADNTGYLASNRDGADNIYEFRLLKPLVLKGQVRDKINGEPIAGATVRLFDENKKQLAFLETDDMGNYSTEINRNTEYPLEAKHIEYQEKNFVISSHDSENLEELVVDIELEPVQDVEYLAEINNIYFDFDKHKIRPDAAKELDKLVDLMKNKYPELVIEIGAHTDFRGSEEYNEELSRRRARATYEYLVSQGIDPDRIKEFQGYGEKKPAVDCDRCDELQHQLNRRSVFSVVKMK